MQSVLLILVLLVQAVHGQYQSPFRSLEHQQRSRQPAYPEPLKIIDAPVHVRVSSCQVPERTLHEGMRLTAPTTCSTPGNYLGNELLYFSSPSLTGPYIQAGSVLGNASVIGSSYNPWAPDITLIDGKFHVYYCVSRFGTQDSTIGLAISSSGEESSFHDLGGLFSTKKGNVSNALDPSLAPGGEYLSYGSYFGGLYLAKLTNLTSIDQSSLPGLKIADGFPSPNAIEGSFIYLRGPWYYLFISSGQCCGFNQHQLPEDNTTEYKILVGRSRSVTGLYHDRNGVGMTHGGGTTVLSSFGDMYAPGGQSVYKDPKSEKDVMIFHYSIREDANLIARLGMYFLDFSDQGWPMVVRE